MANFELPVKSEMCCGCSACASICPKNAITMVENKKGFLHPEISSSLCINCGACEKVCPVLNKPTGNSSTPKIMAFTGNDELLLRSSSGGAFTYIAQKILERGGAVAGAVWAENFSVRHTIIEDIADLDSLRMSKYAQSDQGDCYERTRKLLKDGRTVLYSGTPCQIAGLRNYLGPKEYPNLYTIDLLCHGVPSGKLLREHLNNTYGLENIERIVMRSRTGWQTCLIVLLKNGTFVPQGGKKSIFINAFLNDLIIRESCFTCPFASLPRQGDITLGDMWSAKKLGLGLPFEKKSSIVLLNNDKGKKLWNDSLNNKEYALKDISDVPLKKLNKNIYAPNSSRSEKMDIFWALHKNMPFEASAYKTLYTTNVGLVLYASNNYGSCTTNVALYEAIEKLGYEPIILDSLVSPYGLSKEYMKGRFRMSSSFMEKGDYVSANRLCDAFVLGSDYSLNITAGHTIKHIEYLLMAFAENKKRKIAYAPSLGTPELTKDTATRQLYKNLLSRFQLRTFREDSAVNICRQYFGLDSHWVLDPVFLVDKQVFLDMAAQSELSFKKPYLVAYLLDPSPEKHELIKKAAQEKGVDYVIMLDIAGYDKHIGKFSSSDPVIEKPSMEDWMAYFANSSYVVTDSFHGTCFALMFKTPYISLKNRNKKRFETIAALLGHADNNSKVQIFDAIADVYAQDALFKDMDFDAIEVMLKEGGKRCLDLLKQGLEADTSHLPEDSVETNVQFARLWRETRLLRKELDAVKIGSK